MIITKVEEPHTKQPNKQKGKLEYKTVYHADTFYFTGKLIYVNQSCHDLQTIH